MRDEHYYQRKHICEDIAAQQAKINAIGEHEYEGEKKYRYYRAVWYLQQAVAMLQSMNDQDEAKVIEITK